ncbi:secretion system protein F [Massilia forsythiae]|uniref:Secretion system protein F n=1 Tax=Massilia forsythiae TaxID=2728020 RepID=A0A7Z2ZUI2_9BURK|nr:type II secretion system F family protein [Massilia forsythiae]QJE02320.1 secretion system protein F [Massilia forsythiae]
MRSQSFVIAGVFAAGFLLIWIGLHVGVRRFSQRQRRQAQWARLDLEHLFIFTDAGRIVALNLAVLVLLPLAAWCMTGSLAVAGMGMAPALLGPRYMVRRLARRRLRLFEQQLPDALMMLTGALRAGASLPIALEGVAGETRPPLSQEFDLLLRELRLGVDFAAALAALERRVPLADLALVTGGMALSREVGSNLAETLEATAATIRARLQMEGKIRSLTAQAKMQGVVMAGLPLLLIVVLDLMEPEAMAPLFHAWYGWLTLGVMALTILVGHHVIRRITDIDV